MRGVAGCIGGGERGGAPVLTPHRAAPLPPATDFATIARKIDKGEYAGLSAWLADVALVVANARKFNAPDSDIAALAAKVEAFVAGRLRSDAAWAAASAAQAAPA